MYSPLGITDEPLSVFTTPFSIPEKHYLPYLHCGDRDELLAPHGLLSLRNIPAPALPKLPSSLSAFISQSISLLIWYLWLSSCGYMIRNFTQICNCYSVVNFHILIGFFKPAYRINQSGVVHKGLSWSILRKNVNFWPFTDFRKISYCFDQWLYTSAKYKIYKSCVHYSMMFCVCLWTGLVFFQRFIPESGVLVLAFNQKNRAPSQRRPYKNT